MLAAILGLFTALPELVKLGSEIFKFLQKALGDSPQDFLRDLGSAFEGLNKAQTSEDRQKAALELQKMIKRL